ncbi:hypothetical protein B0H14DRAFT_2625019 [Mycena olivaceomarginata]|nr:hypothetical protein B0H14DRAFT_2625019 [Mycena olivaceomarginata]
MVWNKTEEIGSRNTFTGTKIKPLKERLAGNVTYRCPQSGAEVPDVADAIRTARQRYQGVELGVGAKSSGNDQVQVSPIYDFEIIANDFDQFGIQRRRPKTRQRRISKENTTACPTNPQIAAPDTAFGAIFILSRRVSSLSAGLLKLSRPSRLSAKIPMSTFTDDRGRRLLESELEYARPDPSALQLDVNDYVQLHLSGTPSPFFFVSDETACFFDPRPDVAYADLVIHVRGAGRDLATSVSLYLETPQTTTDKGGDVYKVLNINTLGARVYGLNSFQQTTWTFDYVQPFFPPIEINLIFATVGELQEFLLALSYVRVLEGSSTTVSPVGSTRAELFSDLRAIVYRQQAATRSLPNEILSCIFVFSKASRDQFDLRPTLLLLHICSRWRAVAMEVAELWRDPSFGFGPSSFRLNWPNSCAQMIAWLGAGQVVQHRPFLEVYGCRIRSRGHHLHHPIPAIAVLCSAHSESIFASVPIASFPWPWISHSFFPPNPYPPAPDCEFPAMARDVQLCAAAPLLRNLSINSDWIASPYDNSAFIGAFPWSQLTKLHVGIELGVSFWLPIFKQCHSLQTGKFVLWNDPYDYPLDPVIFQDLVCLRVSFRYVCDTRFLAHVTFPVIRELHIAGFISRDAPAPFMPDYPTLRILNLHVDVPQDALQRIIVAHPDLEHLSVLPMPEEILTISTFITHLDFVRVFIANTPAWAVKAASAGCDLRLFGNLALIEQLWPAVASTNSVNASIEWHPCEDGFDDPLLFPYDHFLFLTTRMGSAS